MRTITVTERALLAAQRVGFWLKVEVKDTDDVWRDLGALAGLDWVVGAVLSADIDAPTASGTVTLWRDDGATKSLSPLRSDSTLNRNLSDVFAPLIDVGRAIRLSEANVLPGFAPGVDDWHESVQGKIDQFDFDSNPGTITFRDLGAHLLDTVIEEERDYGSDNGQPVEFVMQEILDDWMGAGAVDLSTPVSPNWFIRTYAQQSGIKVMDALTELAQQIGWDIRYLYSDSGYALTFYSPDRAKTAPDATFGPGEYFAVSKMSLNDADVRNIVRVRYTDAATGQRASALSSRSGSIAEFGRRYMEIGEASSSNIDTANEAQAMADAASADLQSPKADHAIETFGFWPVQLGDLIEHSPNAVHYDEAQQYAIVGYQHTWKQGSKRTVLTTRGAPAGAYRKWLLLRGGAFTDEPSHGPVPLIGPLGGEASAFGGGANREGMAWLPFRLDADTEHVDVYAVESATTPVAVPELSESRKAWTIRRQDGDIESADEWTGYVMIATRTNYYRKIIAVPIGFTGERGPTTILETQAVDVGTGPAAAPDTLAVTTIGDTNRMTFIVRDSLSRHLIFRNGYVVAFIEAGAVANGDTATFDDTHIDTGVEYTYDACALRNFQSSGFASGSTVPPAASAPNAPTWQAGYPQPGTVGGVAAALFAWNADPTTVSITVEIESTLARDLWYTLLGPFVGAGNIPTGSASSTAYRSGTTGRVRLRAEFGDGSVLYSGEATAAWGTAAPPPPPFAKPLWMNSTPKGTIDTTTLFDWTVPDVRCERLDVEVLVGASWTSIFNTTTDSEIASGEFEVGGIDTTKDYRLHARYNGGTVDTYSLARHIGDAP